MRHGRSVRGRLQVDAVPDFDPAAACGIAKVSPSGAAILVAATVTVVGAMRPMYRVRSFTTKAHLPAAAEQRIWIQTREAAIRGGYIPGLVCAVVSTGVSVRGAFLLWAPCAEIAWAAAVDHVLRRPHTRACSRRIQQIPDTHQHGLFCSSAVPACTVTAAVAWRRLCHFPMPLQSL